MAVTVGSASGITFNGLSSGLDTDTIVAQLIALERRPLTRLTAQKNTITQQQSALTDIQNRMTSLRALLDNLREGSSLRNSSASSSDSKIVSAYADKNAGEGTHTLEVHALAMAERRIQTVGVSASTATVGSSKSTAISTSAVVDADATWFTTQENGATYTFDFGSEAGLTGITFAANTSYSLNQVVSAINARSQALAGYDVASVAEDAGQYKLKLTAANAGGVGIMASELSSGDAIAQLADWSTTDGAPGTFSYTYKGTTRELQMLSSATLENLRDLINNDSANPGVSASILYSGRAYHLVLTADDTGAGNEITINDAQTTLLGFDSADLTVTQQAQNAQVRLDGWPNSDWIERTANTFSDLLTNVTINLQDTGTATITLSRETSTLTTDLNNLVSIYNGLKDTISKYTGYDSTTKSGGVLQGDPIRTVLDGIRTALITRPVGFADEQETFTLAGQLGLQFDKTGKLSLDTSVLQSALSKDYLGALSVIGAQGTGTSSSETIRFVSADDSTAPGTYDVEVDFGEAGQIATARIRAQGETIWQYLDISGNKLTGSADLIGLNLTAVSDGTAGAHTQAATIRIRRGFAGGMYDKVQSMLDTVSGVFAMEKNQFDSKLNSTQSKIDTAQKRLDAQEAILKAKFARLEATLATINTQNAGFQSLIQQLNNNKSSD